MSENFKGSAIIYPEGKQQCDYCGKVAELRPYGKNGACICLACGIKDKKETEKNMGKVLFGRE